MPENGLHGVISIWDEQQSGFEQVARYEIRTSAGFMVQPERLVRTQAVVARVVAGETLIVPVRAKVGDLGSIYKFNGTGTLIWKMLEKSQTMDGLCSAVANHYQIEIGQAERDVSVFVDEMKSVGLVEVATGLATAGD